MTNEEWLNKLSTEEKAKFLARSCNFCSYECGKGYCSEAHCEGGIKLWLKKENIEPMPEIKAGDIVDTNTGLSYVAISPMTLVSRSQRQQYNLEDITKKIPTGITRRIIRILRYDGDCYQTIWSAENE